MGSPDGPASRNLAGTQHDQRTDLRSCRSVSDKPSAAFGSKGRSLTYRKGPVLFAVLLLLLSGVALGVWLAVNRGARAPVPGFAPEAFVVTVPPGGRFCQPGQIIPAGATGVQLTLGAFGRRRGTKVEVTGAESGKLVVLGRRSFSENQNVFVAFLREVGEEVRNAEICIRNVGRLPFQVGGKPGFGGSFRYPDATRKTWLESSGKIASRFRYGRVAPFGAATVWLLMLLALVAVLIGLVSVLRAAQE